MGNIIQARKRDKHALKAFWVLCWAWAVVQAVLILIKMFEYPIPVFIPPSFPLYYFVSLFVYAVLRASIRWAHKSLSEKRGGAFVLGWAIFALILHLIAALTNGRYDVPNVTFTNFFLVASVYVSSRIEKRLYLNLRSKSRQP